jgi:hypothetical protein
VNTFNEWARVMLIQIIKFEITCFLSVVNDIEVVGGDFCLNSRVTGVNVMLTFLRPSFQVKMNDYPIAVGLSEYELIL